MTTMSNRNDPHPGHLIIVALVAGIGIGIATHYFLAADQTKAAYKQGYAAGLEAQQGPSKLEKAAEWLAK